jgi:hypothetical protein
MACCAVDACYLLHYGALPQTPGVEGDLCKSCLHGFDTVSPIPIMGLARVRGRTRYGSFADASL